MAAGPLGGAPAPTPAGAADPGAVDAAPREFPLVTAARRASRSDTLGSPWPSGAPVEVDSPPPAPLDEVVLTRGSQRLMDPTRGREALAYAVFRAAGVPAPRTAFAEVTLTVPGKYDPMQS